MIKILFSVFAFSTILAGCESSADSVKFDVTPINESNVSEAASPVTTADSININSGIQNNVPPQTGNATLNPAHGLPGHRCDIAVGAVLNSTAAANQSSTLPTNTSLQPIQPMATTGTLNPEHGKPGHRCDIAVGAPLNSAAATPQNSSPVINTIVPPINQVLPGTATANLNPAHGQPGHDCSVAVGQPLKQ